MSNLLLQRCLIVSSFALRPARQHSPSLTHALARSPSRPHSGRKFFERDQKRKLLRRQRKEWKRKEGRGQSRRPPRRREERRRSEAGRKRGWKWNTHHQLENPRAGGRGHLARKLLHRSPHITSEIATVVGDSESRHPDPPSQSAAAAPTLVRSIDPLSICLRNRSDLARLGKAVTSLVMYPYELRSLLE